LLLACHSRLSLDFFDSGLHTCTAVARLTLALAKLSCVVCDEIKSCEAISVAVLFNVF